MTLVVTVFSVLLLTFFNTVPLHSQTVTQSQCECINTPSNIVQSCLPYDSRFQAATLEEALHNFPDLTMDQDDDEYLNTLESEATCETQECLDCQMDMRHKLEQVGLMSISTNETVVSKRTSMCKKYRFTRKDRGVYEKSSMESDDSDSSSSEEDEGIEEKKEKKGDWDRYKRQHQRYKRQTLSVNDSSRSVIGVFMHAYVDAFLLMRIVFYESVRSKACNQVTGKNMGGG
ncbi:unnamed protein product [Angiostrongylus costaricensis]|uniref:IlGF domain-containing protein n=1 Tax=Angiostrongylus costaricensis TaxID=334426 RepID=A0A0R3PHM6_ANGCS|nr:unnamed protein product [Angiostrongylus costaricensis]